MWKRALTLAILTLPFAAGCQNVPEVKREALRTEVQNSPDHDETRKRLLLVLMGDAETRRDDDPHLRATAAQGLGEIGHPDDARNLLDVLMGPLRDGHTMVRMECAIALGKLMLPRGELRSTVLLRLRDRLVYDTDERGRPLEREFFVRSAMLNSLIMLQGRDAASAVHDVAVRLHQGIEDGTGAALDRGLFDRCLEGLAELTRIKADAGVNHRVSTDDLNEHLRWWADQIANMPQE